MEFVLYEQKGAYAIITINREKALNALNSAVLEELDQTLDAVDLNTVRCLILTGAGAAPLLIRRLHVHVRGPDPPFPVRLKTLQGIRMKKHGSPHGRALSPQGEDLLCP